MKARAVGERDGWVCWLCDGPVDPDALASSPWAPTVDHVVPRSRGGTSQPDNLRLAHRRCNGRRADRATELEWPAELGLLDAPSLWQTLVRIVRRRSGPEVVALAPDREQAVAAGEWAAERAARFVGGSWTWEVAATGAERCHVVRLAVDGEVGDPGRPKVPDARPGPSRARRGRRRR